jgi:hypothetical protein
VTQEWPDDADPVGVGLDVCGGIAGDNGLGGADEDAGGADDEAGGVGLDDPGEEDVVVADAEPEDAGLEDGVELGDPVGVGVLPLEAAAELLGEVPVDENAKGGLEVGWQAAIASTLQAATAIMADFLFRGLKILPNLVCTICLTVIRADRHVLRSAMFVELHQKITIVLPNSPPLPPCRWP